MSGFVEGHERRSGRRHEKPAERSSNGPMVEKKPNLLMARPHTKSMNLLKGIFADTLSCRRENRVGERERGCGRRNGRLSNSSHFGIVLKPANFAGHWYIRMASWWCSARIWLGGTDIASMRALVSLILQRRCRLCRIDGAHRNHSDRGQAGQKEVFAAARGDKFGQIAGDERGGVGGAARDDVLGRLSPAAD
jgi:hypothetical protein